MYSRAMRLLPICLALLLTPCLTLPAQEVTGAAKTQVLLSAKQQYYNLRAAGVKSFACTAETDWVSLFQTVAGVTLADDNATLTYLRSGRLRFRADLAGTRDVSWQMTGAPPEGMGEKLDGLREAVKKIIDGFVEAWTPGLNGGLFDSGNTLLKTADGYTLRGMSGVAPAQQTDEVLLDKDQHVLEVRNKSTQLDSEMKLTYTASADGLLLTDIRGDTRSPASAPPTKISMTTTYAEIGKVHLPATLAVTVPNVATFNFRFTDCRVMQQGSAPTE